MLIKCTRCETGEFFFLFLKLVQINVILADNVRILYIYSSPKIHFECTSQALQTFDNCAYPKTVI
jgi:hypothetical protein